MLDNQYREAQSQVHPDKFAQSGESERRLSLQWATRVNEAYQTLKKPLSRAQYLLTLAGHDAGGELNTVMSTEFLMQQMEWREALAEARSAADMDELESMHRRVRHQMNADYEEIATLIDDQANYPEAADRVRRLMFLEKLLSEIDEAIASLDE